MNAKTVLTEDERKTIEDRIAAMERQSAAQVVVALATESGRYDRAESVVGLVAAALALAAVDALATRVVPGTGQWGLAAETGYTGQMLALVLGFIGGSLAASYCHPLRRLVTPEQLMTEESQRSAAYVFRMARVADTIERSGLLVYLTLFERRIVVLADTRARAALCDEDLAAVRDAATPLLRRGEVAQGILAALEAAAEPLRCKLPPDRQGMTDSLANYVRVYHPRP